MVRIGLFGITMGACAHADASSRIAVLAENLGYDSVWAPEHAVLPTPRTPDSPLDASAALFDPLITLAHVAAQTTRITLATGVLLLPQHHPVLLSKQVTTLDRLSGGRFVLGVGVGYLERELAAAGVPMAERGARADEYLAALRSLWADPEPHLDGTHVRLIGVDAHPRPVRGTIPIVVGGEAPAAHRRALRHGQGWYGFRLDRAATATQLASLRAAARTLGRDFARLEITITPAERLTSDVVADYAELGVHRLVVAAPAKHRVTWSLADHQDFVSQNAPAAFPGAAARPTPTD